jgi:hypothetical protein
MTNTCIYCKRTEGWGPPLASDRQFASRFDREGRWWFTYQEPQDFCGVAPERWNAAA